MNKLNCDICYGQKSIQGMGMMRKECPKCLGVGYVVGIVDILAQPQYAEPQTYVGTSIREPIQRPQNKLVGMEPVFPDEHVDEVVEANADGSTQYSDAPIEDEFNSDGSWKDKDEDIAPIKRRGRPPREK